MPREVDAIKRRSEFVAAIWRVIHKDGMRAVTLRRVAAEAGCTTGALTHYFTNREALLLEVLHEVHQNAAARMAKLSSGAGSDAERLEAILLESLPLSPQRLQEWKTRLAIWAEAAESPALKRENARRFAQWATFLGACLTKVAPRAALESESLTLSALVDGLALRIVLHGSLQRGLTDEVKALVRARVTRFSTR
jgi:AcrR family transcriptional regulator